jgi:hypothetical protein
MHDQITSKGQQSHVRLKKRTAEYLVSSIILDYIFMFKLTKKSNFLKTTKLKITGGRK